MKKDKCDKCDEEAKYEIYGGIGEYHWMGKLCLKCYKKLKEYFKNETN